MKEGVNRLLAVPADGVWCATNSNIIIYNAEVRRRRSVSRAVEVCSHVGRRQGTQIRALDGHSGRVYALHYSPIFNAVFSGSFDSTIPHILTAHAVTSAQSK